MKTFASITAAAALYMSLLPIQAAHSAADDPPAVKVQFGDLNLSGVAGYAALYNRLSHAAQSVCRDLEPGRSAIDGSKLALLPRYRACISTAIQAAVSSINRPAFSDYVSGKMPPAHLSSIRLAAK